MKARVFLLSVFVSSLLLWGCKENKTGIVIPENVEKYPTALNTEWEYETTTYIAKYDDNGNRGRDSLAWPISKSLVRITSMQDSVYSETNLIRFNFGANSEYSSGIHWYRNNDHSFELIAYSGHERERVTPIKKRNSLEFLKYFFNNLSPDGVIFSPNDSIYINKRTVLEYPLTVGKSWDIYGAFNFSITKTVVEKTQLFYNSSKVECFNIKSVYNSIGGIDEHDYISLELGLLRRETIIDSIEITTMENPNGTGEFIRYKSTSTLIRKSN